MGGGTVRKFDKKSTERRASVALEQGEINYKLSLEDKKKKGGKKETKVSHEFSLELGKFLGSRLDLPKYAKKVIPSLESITSKLLVTKASDLTEGKQFSKTSIGKTVTTAITSLNNINKPKTSGK